MAGLPNNLQDLSPAEYLKAEPMLTIEQKSALAVHLATQLKSDGKGGSVQAEALLRLMAWNAETPVAETMAKAVAANKSAPRSIAWALANDDDSAAKIVLEACLTLSDEDLIGIVETSENQVKMCAIARRPSVSTGVSKSLSELGNEDTVHALLTNADAEIAEETYQTMVDRFGESERIQAGIIDRPTVSTSVVQRLSATICPALAGKFADKLSASARPIDAVPGYSEARSDCEWEARLSPAIAAGSLNEAMLIRHLTIGNFENFARALCALSNSPYYENVQALLELPPSFESLWQRATLPKDWLPIAEATVEALIQVDRDVGKADHKLFSRNIVTRALANLKARKIVLTSEQQRVLNRAAKG